MDSDPTALIPGGVNSPVRSFAGVGDSRPPFAIVRGEGAYLHTDDGRELIDYICGWGSIIAGHAHPAVVRAVSERAGGGLGFGMATRLETEYAARLRERTGLDMFRAVTSGTEAAMTAVRLARGATGRELIVKFAGCYHGHADGMLVEAGSGALTLGQPSSAGVARGTARDTCVLPYNDSDAVRDCFARHGEAIAGVIVEPVAGNMNLVVPSPGFIATLREQCDRHEAVLIADEVMTGLRASPGLVIRDLFGVEPDLACLGKVVGGGLPAAVCAGSRAIMELLAPAGPVYQAGTLAGNPLALAAGLATMDLLDMAAHDRLSATAAAICERMREQARGHGVAFAAHSVGAMAGYCFAPAPPDSLAAVAAADKDAFDRFYHAMLAEGVLLPPSMYEAFFIGLAHTDVELDRTGQACDRAFAQLG